MICEKAPGDRGHYMRTFSGRQFWPMDPKAEDMSIRDVAHHLSLQCRFNGATKDFYSVAEHCVIGSYLVPPEDAFEFLMHDAAEAWLGDLIRPMKNHSILGHEYKRIEAMVEAQVRERWGLADEMPASVKRVDQALCVVELAQAFEIPRRGSEDLDSLSMPELPTLRFWPWHMAESMFLRRFAVLRGKHTRGAR
jgi:hypothetical protein